MPSTMQAGVFHGPHDVRIEEVPAPAEIGPDEALLQVERAAICGTGLHPYEGHMELEEGVVLGHEFLGTVVETGDAVSQVHEGDLAACAISCGACFFFCRRSEPSRCAGIPMFGMVSWVVQAEWEGEQMEDGEIAAFFVLLGSAANDTTRHSLAPGVRLFHEYPDQRGRLLEDVAGRLANACEEILRHATPVQHFRRTVTADTEIRGVEIHAGDKVVMWHCSGNRDEETFPAPSAPAVPASASAPPSDATCSGPDGVNHVPVRWTPPKR